METLTLVLLLVIAVLISAVLDRFVPKVSLPLIQVAMGVVISLFARGSIVIELEPDLFLVLFIAPLLYIEAKHADKAILWKNRGPILSLAIGLVVITMLIIGFVLHALMPAISLAAAFALGAALGPTDAVAVSSLSKQVSIPERQWGILKGELLLNDASGIVCFQFAIAAAATGAFSFLSAGEDFIVEFLGGLIFGVAIGYLSNFILRKIRDVGVESITFHVLFEICIPFVVYLSAAAVHVSGIIAVVVAGLVNVIAPRTVSPAIAHMNIVSSSVWQVISFTLNGVVFVLLGTQIPTAMFYSWEDASISNWTLLALVLLVTLILMGVRFLWCLGMEFAYTKRSSKMRFTRRNLRNALVVTLCGAKGTITLSILFTIPIFLSTGVRFPERHLITFIGCGVILVTLLLATFVVPLVAPQRKRKPTEIQARQEYFECLADILRNVIEELTAQQTRDNITATRRVIQIYQDRLERTKSNTAQEGGESSELRYQALEWEQEHTLELINEGRVGHDVGYEYIGRLERMERFAHHGSRLSLRRALASVRTAFIKVRQAFFRIVPQAAQADSLSEMHQLQMETHVHVLGILHGMITQDDVLTEDVSKLIVEYETTLAALRKRAPSVTTSFKIVDQTDDIRRLAYQLELEEIQKMYERSRIDRHAAKTMRDNVALMQMDLEDKL